MKWKTINTNTEHTTNTPIFTPFIEITEADKFKLTNLNFRNKQRKSTKNISKLFTQCKPNNNNAMIICYLLTETCICIIMTWTLINDPWWFETCLQAYHIAPLPYAASRGKPPNGVALQISPFSVNGCQSKATHVSAFSTSEQFHATAVANSCGALQSAPISC